MADPVAGERATRERLLGWYRRNRARSRQIFELLDPSAYETRPAGWQRPVAFYEANLAAFTVNTYIRVGLGWPGVDDRLDRLFAGDDAAAEQPSNWPSRGEVLEYAARADAILADALADAPLAIDDRPAMRRGQALFAALEREAMRHEALLAKWHQLPYEMKRRPRDYAVTPGGSAPPPFRVRVPAGRARLGAMRDEIPFGWDNEFPAHEIHVPAFDLDTYNVTNEAYLAFVEAGGAAPAFWRRRDGRWFWRGQFEEIPLPPSWPVYVTRTDAEAYARWSGGRLMSEAEFHRAAYGSPGGPERPQPWGSEAANATRGNLDFLSFDPLPVGTFPHGASAFGVRDLVGNGWEWTATSFGPFPGFEPMAACPQHSVPFFAGAHAVLKGASPVTARELARRSFRHWAPPDEPWVYATFRCAYELP